MKKTTNHILDNGITKIVSTRHKIIWPFAQNTEQQYEKHCHIQWKILYEIFITHLKKRQIRDRWFQLRS